MTDSLARHRIAASFDGRGHASLAERALDLLAGQQETWPQLRDAYAALEAVRSRAIREGDLTALLQWNPRRIRSTGAAVDPAAIAARPCFLCSANLPEEQRAILYRRAFLILCNPFPIVPRHFTLSHRDHIPQSLREALPSLLRLAKDFHPVFALLYNGPECGASAPDHLHFQAVPVEAVPVLQNRAGGETLVRQEGGVRLLKAAQRVPPTLIVEGSEEKRLAAFLRRLIDGMGRVLSRQAEPLMNLFCRYDEGRWRVVIFPRRKHRPDAYYGDGDGQIFVSPGAMDMGGLLILPREADFHRLTAGMLRDIFREVSLPEDLIAAIAAAL